MALRVEIVSRETIKPSSPTPNGFKDFKLSFLDQLAATLPVPVVLFYPRSTDDHFYQKNSSYEHLKKSLSLTLTEMYPLAGRQKNQYLIECNDEGAEYVESRVICDMDFVTKHPKLDHLRMLLPYNPHQLSSQNQLSIDQVVLLAVQVNRFSCGGIAIGVCIRHVIADAAATATFFNTWARNSASCYKTDAEYIPRNYVFDCTSLFPPKDLALHFSARASKHNQLIHKTATKRLVLSDSVITDLRKKCSMDDDAKHPTRVEAVAAFLWTTIIQSSRKKFKKHEILLTVNLRKRMVPTLPPHCIGNVFQPSRAQWEAGEEKIVDCKVLTVKLVDEVRKMKDGHIRNIFENGDFLKGMKERLRMVANKGEEMGTLAVSSWCRFPFYETDFGFGKPSWYGTCLNYKDSAILMDTSDGKGMEAWVTLDEEDMEKLEQNSEFLSYFTSTSSQTV